MKATKIFIMAALALMTAACSNGDNDFVQQPAEQPVNGEITITATLNSNDGATTRALSIDGEYIASNYVVGEKIAVLFEYKSEKVQRDAEVKSLSETTATVEFTIPADLTGSQTATLVYPSSAVNATKDGANVAAALATQTGDIAACPEVRTGSGTLDASAKTLTVGSALAAQNAIFKFTLKDIAGTSDKAATEFKVSNGSGKVLTTVTPSSATNTLYVALPVLATGTYWFSATVDSKPYIAKATVGTATTTGKYYQTQVNMATLGDLMGANGKFYANAAAITAASTTAIGVIGYLGTDNFTENGTIVGSSAFVGHGLVLCLKNAASSVCWSTETGTLEFSGQEVNGLDDLKRATNVSGYTNTTTLAAKTDAVTKYPAAYLAKNYSGLTAPDGTTGWFLPSVQQWVKMQTGLGGLSENDIIWESYYNNDCTGATAWENALVKAGDKAYDSMTDSYYMFWSSSENSDNNAVYQGVDTKTEFTHGFSCNFVAKSHFNDYTRVRPVLAF